MILTHFDRFGNYKVLLTLPNGRDHHALNHGGKRGRFYSHAHTGVIQSDYGPPREPLRFYSHAHTGVITWSRILRSASITFLLTRPYGRDRAAPVYLQARF